MVSVMPIDDIACKELVELVTAYFDGALPEWQREAVEKHLEGCGGCRNYMEQMRYTIKLTGTIDEDEVPADVRDSLLGVFRQWKGASHGE